MTTASIRNDLNISNRLLVKDTIRKKGTIARYELAKETGLTPPTVTVIVNELIKDGIVVEIGRGESTGGRRPVMLELNPKVAFVFAVRIQRGEAVTAIFDLAGNILNQHSQVLDTSIPERLVEAIVASFDWLVKNTAIDPKRILWCGIASPGLIDLERGVIKRSSNLGWINTPLAELLSKRLYGIPVHVENISNAAALAEKEFGGGQGSSNLIYLNLSVGIGAGIILNNEIYRGSRGFAGEIGHMTLIPEGGPNCACGADGCFEAICGIEMVLEKVRLAVEDGTFEKLGISKSKLSFEKLLYSKLRQFSEVKQVFRQTGYYIGIAIATLINILNLDTVILGGELAQVGDVLDETISVVKKRVFPEIRDRIQIINSNLKEDPPLKGVYALVVNKIFDIPEWF